MSETNVELARQVMDALARRDLSRVIALSDPGVEWHSFFAELGDEGVYRGHDGTRQYMRDLNDAWEVVRADVDETVGAGDVAVSALERAAELTDEPHRRAERLYLAGDLARELGRPSDSVRFSALVSWGIKDGH